MNDSKNQTSFEIKQVISQPYKYGFQTKIETETFPPGINENIVELISTKKEEPEFLLNFRLRAYQKWKSMDFPNWANLNINKIDIKAICGVSEVTINKCFKKFELMKNQLIPRCVLEKYM